MKVDHFHKWLKLTKHENCGGIELKEFRGAGYVAHTLYRRVVMKRNAGRLQLRVAATAALAFYDSSTGQARF